MGGRSSERVLTAKEDLRNLAKEVRVASKRRGRAAAHLKKLNFPLKQASGRASGSSALGLHALALWAAWPSLSRLQLSSRPQFGAKLLPGQGLIAGFVGGAGGFLLW